MLLSSLLTLIFFTDRSLCGRQLLIDLTHTIQPTIPFFPGQTRFNFTKRIATWMNNESSFFYSSNSFVSSEHMGTHIDAPYHFSPSGWKVDEIPLEYLSSVNARIVDVSKQCETNRNYLITIDDIKHADLFVPENDDELGEYFRFVLIFHTAWAKYWPNQRKYAGEENHLEFPGLSEQLAIYLIETYGNHLVGVGIDTLSIDYGPSKNFSVHQIFAKNNKYGLENVAALNNVISHVGNDFFPLDIFPMKVGNGTGGPCRLIARLTKAVASRNEKNWFGLLIFFILFILFGIIVKIIYDFNLNPNKEF